MTLEGGVVKKRIVLTRTKQGNELLAGRVRALGFEPVSVESIELMPPRDWNAIDASLNSLGGFDWLVFTSSSGASMFKERMGTLGLDLPWQGKPSVAAVGDGTAEELRISGVRVAFVPSEFLTLRLASELPAGNTGEGMPRVLLLRSDIADHRMVEVLRSRGFAVVEHAIYRTETPGSEGIAPAALGRVDAILFASPSAVQGFASRLESKASSEMRRTLAACIGPVTAKAAREHGFERIIMPKAHTFEGLLQELERELSMVTNSNA
jgi:uroporphyrinogen III methyltransferase/synthase